MICIIKILIGILLVAALGGGGWYFYQMQMNASSASPTQNQTAQNNAPVPTATPIAEAKVDDRLESLAYINEKNNFKINGPKGWKSDESGLLGTLVVFLNPEPDKEGKDPFQANINVITESTQGKNLDDYVKASKEVLPKVLQGYKSTEDKKVTVSGSEGYLIGGTFTQGVYKLRNYQLVVVKDGQAYIVTATALASTWSKYSEIMLASMMTFEKQ